MVFLFIFRYDAVEDEEATPENEGAPARQSRITSFFQTKAKGVPQIDRPKFFIRNRIELVTNASRV